MKSLTPGHRMAVRVCLVQVFVVLSFTAGSNHVTRAQGSDSSEITTIDKLERMVRSGVWEDRFQAAHKLQSLSNLDTTRATEILIEGITLEALKPSSLEYGRRSYLSNSERLLRKYTFDLVDLAPASARLLHFYADSLTGDARSWLIIALGLQYEKSAHVELRTILSGATDPNLRAMAARALSVYSDSADIPLFKQALLDAHNVTMQRDYGPESQDMARVVYPVREEAAGGLRKMGFEVILEGAEVTIKEPGKW